MSITLSLSVAAILLISFMLITGMHLIINYYIKWATVLQEAEYIEYCLRYVQIEGSEEQLQAYTDLILKKSDVAKKIKITGTQYKVVCVLGLTSIILLILYAFSGLYSTFRLIHELVEFNSPTYGLLTLPLREELLKTFAFSVLSLYLSHLANIVVLASYKRYKNLDLLKKMESKT